jgi:lipid-A-disaccharide synthase
MQNDIAEFKPDVIIFIDYPGFNMRIAKWARKSIPTHYYISPQIWAWKKIASLTSKDVDKMYVILPFEKIFMKTNIIFRSSLWVTL